MRLSGRLSLFWRVFLVDAVVMGAAALVLAFGPFTLSEHFVLKEVLVLAAGLVIMLLVTLALLHRTLRPLATLTDTMRRIDPLEPGRRVTVEAADADVAALTRAFNDMLSRLERERRESARMALSVQ